jgi:hypothetical protein
LSLHWYFYFIRFKGPLQSEEDVEKRGETLGLNPLPVRNSPCPHYFWSVYWRQVVSMSQAFNPDSFTSFLESVKSPTRTVLTSSMLSVLQVLADSADPLDTPTVVSKTGLPLDNLASDLKALEEQHLVARTLKGGREYLSLTQAGRDYLNV